MEVGHGRIRRAVSASSLNTWAQSVSDASADYIVREARRRGLEVDQWHGQAPVDKFLLSKFSTVFSQPLDPVPEPPQKKRKGSGGAWRAFLHEHRGSGGLLDMKAMSEAAMSKSMP